MRVLALLFVLLLLQACASYGPLQTARSQFKSGDATGALETLETADVGKRDRLLLYLDRGMVAQAAGQHQKSIEAFAKAQDLIDSLDVVSVSQQSASLLSNDWAISYRGEYSERLWINTFQMMNYLLIGKPESAAVEARRALKVIGSHPDVLHGDIVSRLLMAISFEAAGQFDSAAVEYRKLFSDAPDAPGIAESAWRNARRFGRNDEAKQYASHIGGGTQAAFNRDQGELILLVASGFIPRKLPGDLPVNATTRISFPYYPPAWSDELLVSVTDNGQPTEATVTGLPLIELARASLDARGKRIGTRQVARVAGKLAIQNAIEKSVAKSNGSDAGEIIGGLTSLLLFALEQADTRSWETLPGNLSLLRVPLSEGQHSIRVDVSSGLQEHSILIDNISVRRGRPSFRMIRDGVLLVPAVQPSAPALTPVSADAELTQAYLDVNQPLD